MKAMEGSGGEGGQLSRGPLPRQAGHRSAPLQPSHAAPGKQVHGPRGRRPPPCPPPPATEKHRPRGARAPDGRAAPGSFPVTLANDALATPPTLTPRSPRSGRWCPPPCPLAGCASHLVSVLAAALRKTLRRSPRRAGDTPKPSAPCTGPPVTCAPQTRRSGRLSPPRPSSPAPGTLAFSRSSQQSQPSPFAGPLLSPPLTPSDSPTAASQGSAPDQPSAARRPQRPQRVPALSAPAPSYSFLLSSPTT